jgi:hypothetical protein
MHRFIFFFETVLWFRSLAHRALSLFWNLPTFYKACGFELNLYFTSLFNYFFGNQIPLMCASSGDVFRLGRLTLIHASVLELRCSFSSSSPNKPGNVLYNLQPDAEYRDLLNYLRRCFETRRIERCIEEAFSTGLRQACRRPPAGVVAGVTSRWACLCASRQTGVVNFVFAR